MIRSIHDEGNVGGNLAKFTDNEFIPDKVKQIPDVLFKVVHRLKVIVVGIISYLDLWVLDYIFEKAKSSIMWQGKSSKGGNRHSSRKAGYLVTRPQNTILAPTTCVLVMKQTVFVFGGLITAVLILTQIGRYTFLSGDIKVEVLLGLTAIIFLGIGLILRRRQTPALEAPTRPEKLSPADLTNKLKGYQITEREYEVLGHVANGLSNREIAARLFLAESTVKTHVSSLLSKLDARRRTQAVERARAIGLLE